MNQKKNVPDKPWIIKYIEELEQTATDLRFYFCNFNFYYIFRTTWDEHIIELTLPKTSSLGHIDFKFSLYEPCPNPPTIQITLLKQNSNGLGYRMKAPNSKFASSVDENIDFNLGSSDSKGKINFIFFVVI